MNEENDHKYRNPKYPPGWWIIPGMAVGGITVLALACFGPVIALAAYAITFLALVIWIMMKDTFK